MKFVTITLNPALDKTYTVGGELAVGELNRVADISTASGGKGINVSRIIAALGGETEAICVLGGYCGHLIHDSLVREGVNVVPIWIGEPTRTNISVVSRHMTRNVTVNGLTDFEYKSIITEINEPGPTFTPDIEETILAEVEGRIDGASAVVISGSIPPGCSVDIYAKLIAIAKAKGVPSVVDADGESLKIAMSEHPDFIKPNIKELSGLAGVVISDVDTACKVASMYARRNGMHVLATMDSRGSVLAHPDGTYETCDAVPADVKRVKGAGDTYLGAFLWAHASGHDAKEAMKIAARAASALLSMERGCPTREDIIPDL